MGILKACALLLLATAALSGCSLFKSPTEPMTKDALYYFQKGEQDLEAGNDKEAIEDWQKVRDSFTSSELSALAQLKIADTQYANEMYIEAIAGYEDFLKQHPSSIRKGEVLFRLGMCHFRQILPADRDQTATHNALATFEQLKKNFPHQGNEQEIDQMIDRCRERLAANEAYVGNFYLKNKNFKAAISRLEWIRTNYPEYSDMGHVLMDLAQSYQKRGDHPKAAEIFAQLADMKQP